MRKWLGGWVVLQLDGREIKELEVTGWIEGLVNGGVAQMGSREVG